MNWNRRRRCLLSRARESIFVAVLLTTTAHADDIDIYRQGATSPTADNLMFVLDYSGSMKFDVDGVDPALSGKPRRLDILLDAVASMLDSSVGKLNVGIASIYQDRPTGVLWPASDLAADASTVDPDIAPGSFTVKDIINKRLAEFSPYSTTSTVNGLLESYLYFSGGTVSNGYMSPTYGDYHKPDKWNGLSYSGNSYEAAIPLSYTPQDAYDPTIESGVTTYGCSDYTVGGTFPDKSNSCAGQTIDPANCTYKEAVTKMVTVCSSTLNPDGETYTTECNQEERSYDAYDYCTYTKPKYGQWNGANYVSPISNSCQGNHVVLITDGEPTELWDNSYLHDALGITSSVECADYTDLFSAIPSVLNTPNCGPEIAAHMANNDLQAAYPGSRVKTHTIGFTVGNASEQYLKDIATAGNGGFYLASNAAQLSRALQAIVSEVSSDNETFVEVAVDIDRSSFSHDNRAFFSLFKPSAATSWLGNTKGYFLNQDGLVDVNGNPASAAGTTFSSSARSFWSSDVDGADVTAGGASEAILMHPRKLYTYIPDLIGQGGASLAGNSATLLDATNVDITPAMLGLPDETHRQTVLDWLKTAPMGDPLHSVPQLVRYAGRDVLFNMTNQGLIHAIDATHPATIGDTEPGGSELWAYMPAELLDNLPLLAGVAPATDHVYGLDGHMTRWHDDSNRNGLVDDGESIMLVFGMRRGGQSYYALDVSNPTSPSLMWKITGGDVGFDKLAQTWSRASLIPVKKAGAETRVLLFSGGYDAATLDDAATVDIAANGAALYMVDRKGRLLWSVDSNDHSRMIHSIPSNITSTDTDENGLVDRLYVGDVGGNLWRIDIDDVTSSADTKVTLLANLSQDGNQPIFYAPSVAYSGKHYSIGVGTGNRTRPLAAENNGLYMLKDPDTQTGQPATTPTVVTRSDLMDVTSNPIETASTQEKRHAASELMASSKGWYINLRPSEKVLSSVELFEGLLLATSYQPTATVTVGDSCDAGSITSTNRFYMMKLRDATSSSQLYESTSGTDSTTYSRSKILTKSGIPASPKVIFPKGASKVSIAVGGETVSHVYQKINSVLWFAH